MIGSAQKNRSVLFFLLAACHPAPKAVTPLPLDDHWKTLRAEQRVAVDVTRADGSHERRTLRAVIAVERPDRFRLRAFGPAGITLFDLVGRGGRVTVIESLRDPANPTMSAILESLAGDVQAAYDLGDKNTNGRVFSLEGDHRVARDRERTVRIWPRHLEVDNHARHYRVTIDSASQELDVPLEAELFADAPR